MSATLEQNQGSDVPIAIDGTMRDFLDEPSAKTNLRICCYGSSSSSTPDHYLDAARKVGYLLAVRGHTCVNGAGSFGCMAAMNEGAAEGNGHIVGVIHEMWLVDSSDWGVTLRDGGSHDVFRSAAAAGRSESRRGGLRGDGPKRELLVAGGEDLQERKRLLVDKADGLIVLPGGPGTWDELWEMACAVNIGLTVLPIVCVNVNGFYDPFRTMLERAWSDKLTKKRPHEIVHFEETAEGAIRWLEQACAGDKKAAEPTIKKRTMRALRKSSFLHFPVLSVSSDDPSWFLSSGVRRSLSVASDWVSDKHNALSDWWSNPKNMVWATSLVFVAGLIAGVALTEGRQRMALR